MTTMPDWLTSTDEDEAAELAAATETLNGPIAEESVDAMAAKFLRRLSFAEDELAKIDRREKVEHELIATTYGYQRTRVQSNIAQTRAVLEALAQRMGFKAESKKKSRKLAFGMLGRKDYAGKFVIADKAKCAEALKDKAPEVVRATITVSLSWLRNVNQVIAAHITRSKVEPLPVPFDEKSAKLDVLVAEVEAWSKKHDGELPDGCDHTVSRTEWHVEAVSAASIRAAMS